MANHCVFFRSNLKYDGRVFAFINTLSAAYPGDKIFVYNYEKDSRDELSLPSNVKVFYFNSIFKSLENLKLFKALRFFEYNLRSFFYLLSYKPISIQVHHEVTSLGSIFYKKLYRNVVIVYDDKELYHYRDKNIPYMFYLVEKCIIKASDLVVITNNYRKKALFLLNKNRIKKFIIIDNYEFNNRFSSPINKSIIDKVAIVSQSGIRILLHQGTIADHRGRNHLLDIVGLLPDEWKMCFIGARPDEYDNFRNGLDASLHKKMEYFGFIDYNELSSFYKLIDAAVLFYDSTTFNNKYCAPNRLYSAANNGKPVIVNPDNVTLNDFIQQNNNGVSFSNAEDLQYFFKNYALLEANAEIIKGNFEHREILSDLLRFYSS